MKIGIIGYGHVGQAMHALFKEAIIYDKYKKIGTIDEINQKCASVFICVPTNAKLDGSCDVSIVEELIQQLNVSLIIIRSTVYVGFTNQMMQKYQKEIVFQPEYYGETVNHPLTNLQTRTWLSFGGTQKGINLAIQTYQKVLNSNVQIFQADATTTEMAKYMENVFLATKVIFCNEMYDIAQKLGANYDLAREMWVADWRIGSSHTFVYENNRGFGGKCLPKDLSSLIHQANQKDVDATLIKAVAQKNKLYKDKIK